MKILWFNRSIPVSYIETHGGLLGGWQDSLECIVKCYSNIELFIAFKGEGQIKKVDNVTYIPLNINLSKYEWLESQFTWNTESTKLIREAIKVVNDCKPDLIQVFGTEWPFGLIAQYTDIPVVIHVQGALSPINNAKYPPSYNIFTYIAAMKGNIARYIWHYIQITKQKSREKMEKKIFVNVKYYMGRTCWDKAVTKLCNPDRIYFHVDEALRSAFLEGNKHWTLNENNSSKLRIVTIGCSTLYKGLDMIIKTATQLKCLGIDFEWNVVGQMPNEFRMMVEYKEKKKFKDCNINILGFKSPEFISELLCNSSIYVHTTYIDNSPNSLCEAQIMGVPIVSTNVGGISSLVSDGVDGVLVPANDPYRMAFEISELYSDKERMKEYSLKGMERAKIRHNPENIAKDLMNCYTTIIELNK